MKELAPDEKLRRLRSALAMLIGSALRAVKKKYGSEGLEVIAQAWQEDHLNATPGLMRMVGEDEKSLETYCKIVDYADIFYGIEGVWVEKSEEKAVKLEAVCPVAKFWDPEVCEVCYRAAMEGMGKGVTGNPDFTATVQRYQGEQGKVCLVTFDSKRREGIEMSPIKLFANLNFRKRGYIVITYFIIMCFLWVVVPYLPGIYGSIYILWYWVVLAIINMVCLFILSTVHWKEVE